MKSILRNIFRLIVILFSNKKSREAMQYRVKSFNPAPSFWALVPVKTYRKDHMGKHDEVVSQIINKNKQL